MKGFFILLIVALVTVGVWYQWSKRMVTFTYTNYPPQGENIVAFGDSLIEGVGASTGNDFPSQLARLIGRPVENMGVSGNTTRDGVRRLPDVLAREPDIVILLFGGNDYLRRIPSEETFKNLAAIVDGLNEQGVLVVMLGVRGGVLSDAYANAYEQLAQEKNVAFIPNILKGLLGDDELMADTIHPNDKGYEKIAQKVADVLVPLVSR